MKKQKKQKSVFKDINPSCAIVAITGVLMAEVAAEVANALAELKKNKNKKQKKRNKK